MNIIPPEEEDTRPFTVEEIAALDNADKEPEVPLWKKYPYLTEPFAHFPPSKPVVYNPQVDDDEEEHYEHDTDDIKLAKKMWKAANPNDTLKHQQKLYDDGHINELPWEKLVVRDDAAEEALKWAEEQAEKKRMISWMEREGSQQIKKSKEE